MAMMTPDDLRSALGADAALQARIDSIHAACYRAHQSVLHAGCARRGQKPKRSSSTAAWLYQATAQSRSVFPADQEGPPDQRVPRVSVERRARAVVELACPAGGGECAPMKWPWGRPIVEHRSSLTDQVVTAILAAASGGGTRPALATAALETAATLYGSALASCEISGPSVVTRALDATWRAATASELIRRGQCVYIIGADPVDGLHWLRSVIGTCTAGRGRRAGTTASSCRGQAVPRGKHIAAAEVLHLRWLTDPARPWAGVSPLQRAADTASLAGWLEKRLSEESSGPVGSFLPVARYDADADLDADADPLALLRRDIGGARRAKRSSSRPRWRRRILPRPRHARIFKSPDSARIRHAILSSCGSRSHATSAARAASRDRCSTARHQVKPVGKAGDNSSRHRLTGWLSSSRSANLDPVGRRGRD